MLLPSLFASLYEQCYRLSWFYKCPEELLLLLQGSETYTVKPNNAVSQNEGEYGFSLNVTAASDFTLMVWMPFASGEKQGLFMSCIEDRLLRLVCQTCFQ